MEFKIQKLTSKDIGVITLHVKLRDFKFDTIGNIREHQKLDNMHNMFINLRFQVNEAIKEHKLQLLEELRDGGYIDSDIYDLKKKLISKE